MELLVLFLVVFAVATIVGFAVGAIPNVPVWVVTATQVAIALVTARLLP